MVLGAVALGDQPGVGELVEALVLDSHGEGGDALVAPLGHSLGHQGHDQARIHAAREVGAHGDVGDQVGLDGVADPLARLVDDLGLALAPLGGVAQPPVAPDLDRRRRGEVSHPRRLDLGGVEHEQVRGRKLVDPLEEGARAGDETQGQVLVERAQVELRPGRLGAAAGEDRLDLGGEEEAPAVETPVQGLLAEAVARQQELAAPHVPDGKGEHAAQLVDHALAAVLVEMENDLGVAAGLEEMAAADELAPQLAVVVDLAVADDPGAGVLVGDRLMPARQVDDREAAHGEAGLAEEHGALIVRPAVDQGVVHPLERFGISPREVPLTADSAHVRSLSFPLEEPAQARAGEGS